MYVDKLDGLVDVALFEKMSNQWRDEQNRCLREIERHQEADKSYMDEGVQLLELARKAQTLFDRQEPREKRRLLDFLLSNCTWEDGEVVATFRQPFDLLAETVVAERQKKAIRMGFNRLSENWLEQEPSNAHRQLKIKEELQKTIIYTNNIPTDFSARISAGHQPI